MCPEFYLSVDCWSITDGFYKSLRVVRRILFRLLRLLRFAMSGKMFLLCKKRDEHFQTWIGTLSGIAPGE